MQFIQFICRRLSAIKQSTFLRCSSMCILPCFHLAMSNPLRGSNHDKPRERESKLSACWKYKALSLWYIHLSEKIKRLHSISHAPPFKRKIAQSWLGSLGYQTLAFLATVRILVGLVCHFAPYFFDQEMGFCMDWRWETFPEYPKIMFPMIMVSEPMKVIELYIQKTSVITTLHKCSWNLVIKFWVIWPNTMNWKIMSVQRKMQTSCSWCYSK